MSILLLFAWLFVSQCCFQYVASVDATERAAVIDIGTGVEGLPSGWNSDPDTCKWFGISCENDHVSMIAWPAMGLTGTLANNFYNLPYLQTFDVSSNDLNSFIPDSFGFLRSIHEVSLAYNDLSGTLPTSMSYLTNVTFFQLQGNRIYGTIPNSWSSWHLLQTLSLAENRLEGTIPDMFGEMTGLVEVSLGNNSLTGSIPSSLYGATTLQVVNLEGNQLSGSISHRISQWTSVNSLQLDSNRFTGTLPNELGDMVRLRDLDLRYNRFSGTVPDVFGSSSHLMYFLLNDNNFEGTFPASLASTPLIALSVGKTNIKLCNPEISKLQDFTFGGLTMCDVSGLSSCGCSSTWAGCSGPTHCADSMCVGDKPWPLFYCAEDGWRADEGFEVPSGQNMTITGPSWVRGMISMDRSSTLKFHGLDATLHLSGCADIIYAEVEISEEDLKTIIASKSSIHVDTLMVAPCGVATVEVTSKIAVGCKQARSNILTNRDEAGIFSLAVEYTGYYSACATWTIPLMGTIHALIIAAGIAYLVITYCRPGYK